MFKMGVVALLVAGLMGLACSSSGLKSRAGDGAAGGQAGSTISSGTTGGNGGMIGPGGVGDGSTGGTGVPAGPVPTCKAYPGYGCNPGDREIGVSFASYYGDQSTDCPSGRECYSLGGNCGSILCVLPEGVHCSDSLLCNPGDTQIAQWGPDCVGWPSPCYTKKLCMQQSTACRHGTDAGVDASGKPEPDSSSQRVGAPHPQPCLASEFLNSGKECSGPPEKESCQSTGNGWCYTLCEQDSTCAGGFVCATIYTFDISILPLQYSVCDGPLGAPVGGACRSDEDCNAGASCMTSTHCGDASVCSVCQN